MFHEIMEQIIDERKCSLNLRQKLLQLENDLLNLLENTPLITTLNNTKNTSFDITEQLNKSIVTNQKINNSHKDHVALLYPGNVTS